MPVKATIQLGDPRLKAKNDAVTGKNAVAANKVITDLIDTMRENQLIGMAAPQIGQNIQVFVTEPRETKTRPANQTDILRIYINPNIVWSSDEMSVVYEGCGSVVRGQLFGPVSRPKTIKIEYDNEQRIRCWLKCDGILARVIQHEYDHLQGIEFTEKISNYRQLLSLEAYIRDIKDSINQVVASRVTIKEEGKV